MENEAKRVVVDTSGNPGPIGLLGFGMTTILLNLHNAGLFEVGSMIPGMGIFVGGAAQIKAGQMEWKKGNTFAGTAFTLYGFFWLSLVAHWLLPAFGLTPSSNSYAMGWYLTVWGIFTLSMFIGTLRLNRALQVVFASLALLFFLLAAGDFTHSATIKHLAGITGVFCGASAFYTAIAEILNEVYGKVVLPICPIKKQDS